MIQPLKIEDALRVENATFIGGGTDIMPLLKNHVRNDSNLVFTGKLTELRGITKEQGAIIIGAGETLHDISVNEQIKNHLPAVAQAASVTASPQIRNIATIGGNILQDRRCIYFNQSQFWRSGLPLCFKTGGQVCHQIPNSPVCRAIYYSDVATALVLYDAEAECIENGEKKWLPVETLIARHIEANGLSCESHLPLLVVRFRINLSDQGEKSGFYKYTMRETIDFPLINFALRCHGDRGAKIVAGAVAPQPVVLEDTAKLLDAGANEQDILASAEAELKKLAMPIKEAIISPAMKRELYRQLSFLLPLYR